MVRSLLVAALAVGLPVTASADAADNRSGPTAAQPIDAPRGSGIVADPSFEDGTPNSYWGESSTRFGTPLCDVSCGAGGSSAPVRTGLWWAWFGGFPSGTETASLTQSISIPAHSYATLDFGFQAPACVASASNFIEARINGVAVWRADASSPRCGIPAYADISVDVSQFSGQTVALSFNSTTTGNGSTNFFIDDVQVTASALPLPVPGWSALGSSLLVLMLGVVGLRGTRTISRVSTLRSR